MPDKQPLDDFITRVSQMADELGLKDDEKTEYVSRHAKAKGYRMVPTWVKEGDQKGQSGFFGNSGDNSASGSKGWFPGE